MLTKLRLERFKNFKEAELSLGPLTVLVGVNASGKSNIRDAFRFLHGIGRGYTLADIIGEKYVEGGILQWRGIRGGTQEAAFQGFGTFVIEVTFHLDIEATQGSTTYRIQVDPRAKTGIPFLVDESLVVEGFDDPIFKTFRGNKGNILPVQLFKAGFLGDIFLGDNFLDFPDHQPLVSQLVGRSPLTSYPETNKTVQEVCQAVLEVFRNIRFLDLSPDAMRLPSLPGQTVLGDRGENLSSALQNICQDTQRKKNLLSWLEELTPMDAVDFEFPADFTGKVLLMLIEASGQKTSAYSASDGTLRFLAMLAALLSAPPNQVYFFEELDNGIHPTRLHLLMDLIEGQVNHKAIQIITTTHSPELLNLLNESSLEYASLIYRLSHQSNAQIQRILDIPDARRLIEKKDLGHLLEAGWLENAMDFLTPDGETDTAVEEIGV